MNRFSPRATTPGWILLALLSCPAFGQGETETVTQPTIELPNKESFHLFVLAGQSNMAGRGEVTDADRQPHERLYMWSEDGRWVPAVDPVHFDKPKVVGVGPGRTFGISHANARPDISIGLIPCAVGGSPIDCWLPGGYHSSTKTHPYDDAVKRIRAASDDGTIQGILWHQGEGDSSPNRAEVYQEKLLGVLQRLRAECGGEPPIMIGQLGQFPERPWTEGRRMVNWAHRQVALKLPHAAFVSSDGLTSNPDLIHFNRFSAVLFGYRYHDAYLGLRNAVPGVKTDRIEDALTTIREHLRTQEKISGNVAEKWSLCHAWLTPEERRQAVQLIIEPEYWVAENLRGYPLEEQVSLLSLVDMSEASDELAHRVAAVAEMWAVKDADAARHWLRTIESDYCRGHGIEALLATVFERDPSASLDLLGHLTDQEADDLIGYAEMPDYELDAQTWAKEVATFESALLRNFLQSGSVVWKLALEDTEAALSYVAGLPEAQQNPRQGWQIIASWMKQQPANASQVLEWMETRLPERLRSDAHYQNIAQWWHPMDREALVQWLNELPAGTRRDAVLQGFIGEESHTDIESAYQWAKQIQNEHDRLTVNARLLRRWLATDPDAVRELLPTAELLKQDREDIERRLQRP
ncbi:sialate O-acetylesterase [Aporhodopirellula aestuarii]|uniref:Sialate O-acetylesterase n=1 Tax=Aporhodopirellula aestuarii TaxID=2950107 RepID=A0ABT0U349_9BACT|nr:sialate O-acetylesterase [Aporhodopirellula aestuarii]MCM2371005.1 sialate O-acetylesterase [Aporhodopirellula aestuarii]